MYAEDPTPYYIDAVVEQFRASSHRHQDDNGSHAVMIEQSRELIEPFVRQVYPVLRHYHPDIVGKCLALSYDDPELGRRSELHGFGSDMRAGYHPRAHTGGSYRDDGSYLSLAAYDYFEKVAPK